MANTIEVTVPVNADIHHTQEKTVAEVLEEASLQPAETEFLNGAIAGTIVASKCVVANAQSNIGAPKMTSFYLGTSGAETQVTASAAELNYNDITTLGTGAASKAIVLDANGAYTGPTAATTKLTWNVTSDSTDGATSVEPFVHNTTMTGAGGVGGRARFQLDTNVALGGWSNALKAQTVYGATGKTTGLGSAFCAELTLSAGTVDGNYAPLELELNVGTGASTGTATSLIHAAINGADAATFDTNGYLLNLSGVTVAGTKVAATGTITNINEVTHGLRVKIAGDDYYLLAATAANFNA